MGAEDQAEGDGFALGALVFGASVYVVPAYGAVLFVGAPIAMGGATSWRLDRDVRHPTSVHHRTLATMLLAACSTLLLLGLEGLICVALASILAAPFVLAGGLLGRALAATRHPAKRGVVALVFALPVLGAVEPFVRDTPLLEVESAIEIDAPPEDVWPHVLAFPELPPPSRWVFAMGIAYPIGARIEGTGVGAVRHCDFSTGPFVEPVTVWDPPHRLAFDVALSPPPMTETSLFEEIHAPHLDGSFASRRGEFRLVPLDGGTRTRLEGTTWYELEMGPRWYWSAWTEHFVGSIHERVLEHIRDQVRPVGRPANPTVAAR